MSNDHVDIENQSTNILCFDPSQKYTGWLLYKPHKIVQYGCIRDDEMLDGFKFTGVMEKRSMFQVLYADKLVSLMRLLDPEHTDVVIEKPIGSQSSRAAWALAMASTGVITACVAMFRKKPILYSERDAKMHMFNSHTVSKERTLKYMWAYWRGQGIEEPKSKWVRDTNSEQRKKMEAVADAMLILNLHLHRHNETK